MATYGNITTERRADDWIAFADGNRGIWERGQNEAEALGYLTIRLAREAENDRKRTSDQNYVLKDSTGKVLFRGVPESQREQAEQIATMLDGGIRRTLARAAGAVGLTYSFEKFTWEVEDPDSTDTYSVYSLEPDED